MWTAILSMAWPLVQKALPYILCVVLAFWAWHKFKKWVAGPPEPTTISATVKGTVDARTLTIEAGPRGRQTRNVSLYGIEITNEQGAKDIVAKYLAPKDIIQIEIIEGRARFGGNLVGIVTAANGANLNLALLRSGFAKNTTARKDFINAEKQAPQPIDPNHRKRWWGSEE